MSASSSLPAPEHSPGAAAAPSVVMLPGSTFLMGSAAVAAAVFALGFYVSIPAWVLAVEVIATVVGLFVFGSFKYQVHKNALTYGMALVMTATFFGIWWPTSGTKAVYDAQGFAAAFGPLIGRNLLSWQGLDKLIHIDTMMFILGLTLFVAVIAQTRLLETITFALLRRNDGWVLPTVIMVTAVVGFSSGILDGVSMIGLTIRTLTIIMLLAAAPVATVRYAVVICTVVTTVCGMWLAYGEPPNLIMKANLKGPDGETLLTDGFFLRYCAPAALASFIVVAFNLSRRLKGQRIDLSQLDVIDANAAKVRFLQAARHGEVVSGIEALEEHRGELGGKTEALEAHIRKGEPLGLALVKESVPEELRKKILSEYVDGEVAASLDRHYVLEAKGEHAAALEAEKEVGRLLQELSPLQDRAMKFGIVALLVFVVLLVTHAINHDVPLFVASFSGFVVALLGIVKLPKMRGLALKDARHEFGEYYFLFPLFFSITLLTKVGFFDQLQHMVDAGIRTMGMTSMALLQFLGCTFLSAILDNNVVADFASHALHDLPITVLHLFAMAQIAGYAAGGCWTHIGCAQSVVAFSFIQRDVDPHYTPLMWIKDMTVVLLQLIVVLSIFIVIVAGLGV